AKPGRPQDYKAIN
ncbi:DNA repair RadC family protein, partial [Vibrio parahaemolyticus V-223/04]